METKPLLFGIIGFLIGGLLVSTVATTLSKPEPVTTGMTMEQMSSSLQGKNGDAYDKAFVNQMINHHQGSIDMAKQSAERAKHQEVKSLSNAIITAQEKEIAEMKEWQKQWGYEGMPPENM